MILFDLVYWLQNLRQELVNNGDYMRILFSTVGRRGYLIKFLRQSVDSQVEIFGGDTSPYAAGFAYCDHKTLFPRVTDPNYVDILFDFAKKNQIDMIIPLVDPELEVLAAQRQRFYDENIFVVISPLDTVRMAFDKYLTVEFGSQNGIRVPRTSLQVEEVVAEINNNKLKWPVVVKPRKGSASAHISYCTDENQLESAFQSCPNPMIQEFLEGPEYGYDLFGDMNGQLISVFCKKKLTMRAGETDKAISTADAVLIEFGRKIGAAMPLCGPVDVDVIADKEGPKLLEINPRFGGGYPCSHLAGADFFRKLIALCQGKSLRPDIGSCPDGVCMLKQDEIISPDWNDLLSEYQ